jgi:hypothetical protein
MIIIVGLIILTAALLVGAAGVMGNGGSAHAVSHFSVLGYHLTGSAGSLFGSGIVVGAAGLAGLALLLAGARRTSRRGSAARRGLRQSRRETAIATRERDNLIDQRDTARADTALADTAGQLTDSTVTANRNVHLSPAGDRWSRLRDLRHRLVPAQTPEQHDSPAAPANSPDTGVTAISPAADVSASASDPDSAAASPALDAHASASAPAE